MNKVNQLFLHLKLVIITLFFTSLSNQAFATSYIDFQQDGNGILVNTDAGKVKITALHQSAFEVLYKAEARRIIPSYSKDLAEIAKHAPKLSIVNNKESITLTTNKMTAVIQKQPFNISFYQGNELLIAEENGFFEQSTLQGFRFKLNPDEKLMGTGERVLGMDRRGQRLPFYNRAHYGYTTESRQMNFGIPAVFSSNKYVLLFDNTAKGWVDLGQSEQDILQFETNGGRPAYIVMAGDTYPEMIHSYVNVTGKQPIPPRWAFGNHSSRFGYKNQQEVIDTISLFREKHIPVDSIILDLYWFGADVQGHMGNLDWDKNTFPMPIEMINTLKQNGVNTVLISEPFILTTSNRWEDAVTRNALGKNITNEQPKVYDFFFGNSGLVDVFSNDGQQWFAEIYQELAQQGVAGVWGDLGEPEVHPADMIHNLGDTGILATGDEMHNAYGHQWGQLVFNALKKQQDNVRPFIIMRSGFAGSQRFGMIPWTGDVSRSWGGLKPQVELSLQMSLLGMAYTHSDLGGFVGGGEFDQEMYIRWLQYGVFQPIYRPHGQEAIAPEPVFHDQKTQDIIREFINLRYQLLPYNYTLAYENSTTGMPLMRPMFFIDEDNEALIKYRDQYFWGNDFLVKPVTDPKLASIEVTLPKGIWFDYFSDTRYQGGAVINYPLSLKTIPVMVKAGAIIPSVDLVQSTANYQSDNLFLDYYYDPSVAKSSAQMYEDDGKSADAIETKAFELLQFNTEQKANKLMLNLQRSTQGRGYANMPKKRSVTIRIHHWQKGGNELTVNNKAIAMVESVNALTSNSNSAFYDEKQQLLTIKIDWDHSLTSVVVDNK